jgi:hypothetical protein
VVLGVGLGEPAEDDFGAFGLPVGDRERAARLDEGLAVLEQAWTGEAFRHDGEHFRVDAELRPAPLAPVPVWVAGKWPGIKPFERAMRHQGVIPIDPGGGPLHPQAYAAVASFCGAPRAGFDVVATVMDGLPASAYAEAGATWALWSTWPFDDWQQRIRQVIEAGPPADAG